MGEGEGLFTESEVSGISVTVLSNGVLRMKCDENGRVSIYLEDRDSVITRFSGEMEWRNLKDLFPTNLTGSTTEEIREKLQSMPEFFLEG